MKKIVYVFIVAIILAGAWIGFRTYQNNRFNSQLTTLIEDMKGVGLRSAAICGGYSEAWHDAIYKEGSYAYGERHYGLDFNAAIGAFHDEMEKPLSDLSSDFDQIAVKIKEMPSPFGHLKEAEGKLHDCYIDLSKLVSLAQSPTGSLVEFNKNVSSLGSTIAAELQELKLY